jgi:hypothetical protein
MSLTLAASRGRESKSLNRWTNGYRTIFNIVEHRHRRCCPSKDEVDAVGSHTDVAKERARSTGQTTVRPHWARLRLQLAEMERGIGWTLMRQLSRALVVAMLLSRRRQRKRRVMATIMQSFWRTHSARVTYLEQVSACISVQAAMSPAVKV